MQSQKWIIEEQSNEIIDLKEYKDENEKVLNNYMNEIDLLNSELIDVKTEITLIKFRDVIKNI